MYGGVTQAAAGEIACGTSDVIADILKTRPYHTEGVVYICSRGEVNCSGGGIGFALTLALCLSAHLPHDARQTAAACRQLDHFLQNKAPGFLTHYKSTLRIACSPLVPRGSQR